MSESIRIRTTPNGNDTYLKVKLDQEFDFIEILSLKISQDKVYQNFCSDYGVIVGRVTIGNGFGIPNAKVSVFIPVDDIDKENPAILGLYPYEKVTDKNSEGVRYNLLPKESDTEDKCFTPVGTFPSKREILDNEDASYVYCKYYKFTSTTNHAGDFMIFGVPIGQHTLHVDADISDIGLISQKPYDFIEQGIPSKNFDSPQKYKASKNLDTLNQIKTANTGVYVQPFWGQEDICQIGINRVDINLSYNPKPSAFFMGSFFGDSGKNTVNKNCRPRRDMGKMCEQVTSEGMIEMIRVTPDGDVESFNVNGGQVIDEDGTWAYQVPCNLDYVVTNEFGDIVLSDSTDRGIPTRARVRFKVSSQVGGKIGRKRTKGKYLVPHNPKTLSNIDFSFDESTKDNAYNFRDLYWNKIYTVKNYISRFERFSARVKNSTYTGIKDVDACAGQNVPMPYSRTLTKINVLFTVICFILTLIGGIVSLINDFLCILKRICIPVVNYCPFKNIKLIKLTCPADGGRDYYPGSCGDSLSDYLQCISFALAEQFNLFQFDFYNEWINGTLYFYLLKYKKKRKGKEKFCETYCNTVAAGSSGIVVNISPNGTGYNFCLPNKLIDTTYSGPRNQRSNLTFSGLLVKYQDELYYPPITVDGNNRLLFATDIVCLGSISNCDWQNFPKIIQYFNDSSYDIPPDIDETPEPNDPDQTYTAGIVNLFFNVDCTGLDFNSIQAQNIRRQCELQVDVPENIGSVPNFIGINEIYDTQDPVDVANSFNRYIRNVFTLLNISGPSILSYPPISTTNIDLPAQGTSFNINGPAPVAANNGALYMQFRNFVNNDPLGYTGQDNSYYFYFGLVPGRTAIDKFNQRYLAECPALEQDRFIIETTVTNTTQLGSNNGAITFTFIGGSSPFVYTWVGTNNTSYSFGPATATTSGTITGLAAGTYQITATDSNGIIMVKDVTVDGPPVLSCSFYPSQAPTSQTTVDGQILMIIGGGTPPYNVSGTLGNGQVLQLGPYQTNVNQLINNVPYGTANFTVTDSATPQGVCSSQLLIDAPPPVSITLRRVQDESCQGSCDGYIQLSISGGESPYTFAATGPNNFNVPPNTPTLQIDSLLSNLCKGQYTITATDSNAQTSTQQVTVFKQISPIISFNDPSINNTKQCNPNYYSIKFKIEPCNPGIYDVCGTVPYTLTYTIDGVQNTTTVNYLGNPLTVGVNEIRIPQPIFGLLQLSIQDSNQCNSNQLSLPIVVIRRPTQTLSATFSQSGTRYITYNINGGIPPYVSNTYSNQGDVYHWTAPQVGVYHTIIQDSVGCTITLQVTVV